MTKTCVICKKQSFPGDVTRSFHQFPKNSEMRQQWLEATGIQEVKKVYAVCSDHFRDECYHQTDGYTKIRRLLSTAVPECSSNSPNNIETQDSVEENDEMSLNEDSVDIDDSYSMNMCQYVSVTIDVDNASTIVDGESAQDIISYNDCDTVPSLPQLTCEPLPETSEESSTNRNHPTTIKCSPPKKKYRFMDGIQQVHISRSDFVSDNAWGRFVKLMKYKRKQISRAEKRSLRRGKKIANLKKSVKIVENKASSAAGTI